MEFILFERFSLRYNLVDDFINISILDPEPTANTYKVLENLIPLCINKRVEIICATDNAIFDTAKAVSDICGKRLINPIINTCWMPGEAALINIDILLYLINHEISVTLRRSREIIMKANIEDGEMHDRSIIKMTRPFSIRVKGEVIRRIEFRPIKLIDTPNGPELREVKLTVGEVDGILYGLGMADHNYYKDLMSQRITQKWDFMRLFYNEGPHKTQVLNTSIDLGLAQRLFCSRYVYDFLVAFHQNVGYVVNPEHGDGSLLICTDRTAGNLDTESLIDIATSVSNYVVMDLDQDKEFMRGRENKVTELRRLQTRMRRNTGNIDDIDRYPMNDRRFLNEDYTIKSRNQWIEMTRYSAMMRAAMRRLRIGDVASLMVDNTGHIQRTSRAHALMRQVNVIKANIIDTNIELNDIAYFLVNEISYEISAVENELGLVDNRGQFGIMQCLRYIGLNRDYPTTAGYAHHYWSLMNSNLSLSDTDLQIAARQLKGMFGEEFVAKCLNQDYDVNIAPSILEILQNVGIDDRSLSMSVLDLNRKPDLYYVERGVHYVWEVGYQTNVQQKRMDDMAYYRTLTEEMPDARVIQFGYAHFTPDRQSWINFAGNHGAERIIEQTWHVKDLIHNLFSEINAQTSLSSKYIVEAGSNMSHWRKTLVVPKSPFIFISEQQTIDKLLFLERNNPTLPAGTFTEYIRNTGRYPHLNYTDAECEEVVSRAAQHVWNLTLAGDRKVLEEIDADSIERLIARWTEKSRTTTTFERRIDCFCQLPLSFDYQYSGMLVESLDSHCLDLSIKVSAMPPGKYKTAAFKCLNHYSLTHGVFLKMRRSGNCMTYRKDYVKLTLDIHRKEMIETYLTSAFEYLKAEFRVPEGADRDHVVFKFLKDQINFAELERTDQMSPMTESAFKGLDVLKPMWLLSGKKWVATFRSRNDPDNKQQQLEESNQNIDWERKSFVKLNEFFTALKHDDTTDCNLEGMLNDKFIEGAAQSFYPDTASSLLPGYISKLKDLTLGKRYTKYAHLAFQIANAILDTLPNRRSSGRLIVRRLPHFRSYIVMVLPYQRDGIVKCCLVRDAAPAEVFRISENGPPDNKRESHEFYVNQSTLLVWDSCYCRALCASINLLEKEQRIVDVINGMEDAVEHFHELMSKHIWLILDNKRNFDIGISSLRYMVMNMQSIGMYPEDLADKFAIPIRSTKMAWFIRRCFVVLREGWEQMQYIKQDAINYLRKETHYKEPTIPDWLCPGYNVTKHKSIMITFYRYHLIGKGIRNHLHETIAVTSKNWKAHRKAEILREQDRELYQYTMTGVCDCGCEGFEERTNHYIERFDQMPWAFDAEITYCLGRTHFRRDYPSLQNAPWRKRNKQNYGLSTIAKPSGMLAENQTDKVNVREYVQDKRTNNVRKLGLHLRGAKLDNEEQDTLIKDVYPDLSDEELKLLMIGRSGMFYIKDEDVINVIRGNMIFKQESLSKTFKDVGKKIIIETNLKAKDVMRVSSKSKRVAPKSWSVESGILKVKNEIVYKEPDELILAKMRELELELRQLDTNLNRDIGIAGLTTLSDSINEKHAEIVQWWPQENFFSLLVEAVYILAKDGLLKKINKAHFSANVREDFMNRWLEHSKIHPSVEELNFVCNAFETITSETTFVEAVANAISLGPVITNLNDAANRLLLMTYSSDFVDKRIAVKSIIENLAGLRGKGWSQSIMDRYCNKRTKSIFELNKTTIYNHLTGTSNSKVRAAIKALKEFRTERYGQNNKDQHTGSRETASMDSYTRMIAYFVESVCESACFYIPEETLSKGGKSFKIVDSVWEFITSYYANCTDPQRVYTTIGCKDHSGWAPNLTGSKILQSIMACREMFDPGTLHGLIIGLSSCMVKRDELPSIMWQLFLDTPDEKWVNSDQVLTWMRNNFKEDNLTFIWKTLDTKQGIKHFASSFFICVTCLPMYAELARIMQRLGVRLTFKFNEGSDDLIDCFITERLEAQAAWVREQTDEQIHRKLHEYITNFKEYIGIKQGAKSAICIDTAEYNSEFSSRARNTAAEIKFYTAHSNFDNGETLEDHQSSIRNGCLEALKQGVSLLTVTTMWACKQTRLSNVTRVHENSELLGLKPWTMPITLGGCLTPNMLDIIYLNVVKVEAARLKHIRDSGNMMAELVLSWCQPGRMDGTNELLVKWGEISESVFKLPAANPRTNKTEEYNRMANNIKEIRENIQREHQEYLYEYLMEKNEALSTDTELIRYEKTLRSRKMIRKMIGTTNSQCVALFKEKYHSKYIRCPIPPAIIKEQGITYVETKDGEFRLSLSDFIKVTRYYHYNENMRAYIQELYQSAPIKFDTSATFDTYYNRRTSSANPAIGSVSGRCLFQIQSAKREISNPLEIILMLHLYPEKREHIQSTRVILDTLSSELDYIKTNFPVEMAVLEETKVFSEEISLADKARIDQAYSNLRENVTATGAKDMRIITNSTKDAKGEIVFDSVSRNNIVGGMSFNFDDRGANLQHQGQVIERNIMSTVVSVVGTVFKNQHQIIRGLQSLTSLKLSDEKSLGTLLINLAESGYNRLVQADARMICHILRLTSPDDSLTKYLASSFIGVEKVFLEGFNISFLFTGRIGTALYTQNNEGVSIQLTRRDMASEAMNAFSYALNEYKVARMGSIIDWSVYYRNVPGLKITYSKGRYVIGNRGIGGTGIPASIVQLPPNPTRRYYYPEARVEVKIETDSIKAVVFSPPAGNTYTADIDESIIEDSFISRKYHTFCEKFKREDCTITINEMRFKTQISIQDFGLVRNMVNHMRLDNNAMEVDFDRDPDIPQWHSDMDDRRKIIEELARLRGNQDEYNLRVLQLKTVDPYLYRQIRTPFELQSVEEYSGPDVSDFDRLISLLTMSKSSKVPISALIICSRLSNLEVISKVFSRIRSMCRRNIGTHLMQFLYFLAVLYRRRSFINVVASSSDDDLDDIFNNPCGERFSRIIMVVKRQIYDTGGTEAYVIPTIMSLMINSTANCSYRSRTNVIKILMYGYKQPPCIIIHSNTELAGMHRTNDLRRACLEYNMAKVAKDEALAAAKDNNRERVNIRNRIRIWYANDAEDARNEDIIGDLHARQIIVGEAAEACERLQEQREHELKLAYEALMLNCTLVGSNNYELTAFDTETYEDIIKSVDEDVKAFIRISTNPIDFKYYVDVFERFPDALH